jgi:hypothetical protein
MGYWSARFRLDALKTRLTAIFPKTSYVCFAMIMKGLILMTASLLIQPSYTVKNRSRLMGMTYFIHPDNRM